MLLLLCTYFEILGLKACVSADAHEGTMRSMFNMVVLFAMSIYVLI